MAQSVTVFTTPLCGPCEALKRALKSRGVDFQIVDLLMDEEAAERLEEHGIRSAPALDVDGKLYAGIELSDEKLNALFRG